MSDQDNDMKKHINDFILTRKEACQKNFYFYEFQSEKQLEKIIPGQFVQVKIDDSPNTFLRRPFSIHDVDYKNNSLQLLIKIVGDGSKRLSILKPGDKVNMMYPLGNGFPLYENRKALLAGGGYGIAPLYHLARELKPLNTACDFIFGARNINDLILTEKFSETAPLEICTEDASAGFHGMITEHPAFENLDKQYDVVYTCGPEPMMKAIAAIAEEKNVECLLSLDNLMGCGIGVCLCCITPTNNGNEIVCLNGPVFNSKDLKW